MEPGHPPFAAAASGLTTVGIDVGGTRKGFHAVALRDGAYAGQLASREVQDLAHWCREVVRARVIAIDAPCRWSVDGRARPCERELRRQAGLDPAPLTSIDWIDAGLCALAAHHAATGGECVTYGEAQTGWIVVPRQHITQLDFTGPHEVLARLPGARCMLASSTGGDLEADGGLVFTRVRKLADIERCELLCVPGGFGAIEAMEDQELLTQLRRLARDARYVTSVCTGALVLGAAGLLQGKRATSHWAWRDALSAFGAMVDDSRVVRDGNVLTGAGVTAGIDFALTVLAEVAGDAFAQSVQLSIEYAPAPPFDSGRPELAPPAILALSQQRYERIRPARDAAVQRAAARLP
jgi:putative intracellular protease/amidase